MRITIHDKKKRINDQAIEHAKTKVRGLMSKFGLSVLTVNLYIDEASTTNSRPSKECRIVVKLKQMDDVAIVVTESSFSKSISKAIARCERAVSRKIQRRALREATTHSRVGFAFYN